MAKYLKIIKARWDSSSNKLIFWAWIGLRIKKTLKLNFTENCRRDGQKMIDVIIPTISKDYLLLETVLASLKNVCQPINKIFIVSQKEQFIIDFCLKHDCTFVDEREVLGYGKEAIDYKVGGQDRSGWLFQQLLKLAGDRIAEMENFLVIDSDTVLIKPHSFIAGERFVFFESEEWNQDYFTAFQTIFGYRPKSLVSHVCHMMIFNNQYLREMKAEMEKKNKTGWDKVVISTKNNGAVSCFSEYETYSNWLLQKHPGAVKFQPFYNKSLAKDKLTSLDDLASHFGNRYNSLSFHSYYG